MELRGKTIVISGGSSGIGLEVIKNFSAKGSTVFSFDLVPFPEPIENVHSILADVSNADDVRRGFRKVEGTIDILFNNAGVMRRGTIFESSEEDFDALFRVHLKGSWLMLKEARAKLKEQALLVQMSSRHALNPQKDPGLYSIVKQAAVHLMENVGRDFPQYRVKLIFPGPVDTPLAAYGLTPAQVEEKKNIMHSPEHVAGKIIELIESDDLTRLDFDSRTEVWDYVLR